ncbi:MAG: cytochrome P450 [Pseudomonadales bacterium]|nr:cytochrome P450 [Pseudomonadales bacterium]MBO6563793.1 cytochrome P450 [Pseudomonadales bacterium]MBO6595719.1 cytochrome P450 [Pseudomonadales bacterium]MBO6702219.1 cytochrome P450 [Pseudomonadales bacterium]MBO6820723.1 cytochrome P450 [Pseudomonadales bacterium]
MTKPYETVVPASLDEVNLLDAGLQNCPYHAYQMLRDDAPVWIDPITGFYVISRFEDMRQVLLDTKNFSNDMRGGQGGSREQLDSDRAARMMKLYEDKGWVPGATLAGRDDPNHKQMRAMFNEAFKPKKIDGMDPFVRDTAYKLIDAFVDDGHCDWIHQYAVPLPLIVIGAQVGVPEEDIWKIKAWTDAWVQRLGMMQTEEEEQWSVEMEIEAQHYFQKIFDRLREEPDDSLLSVLVNREIPEWGRTLTDNELHAEMMADTFVGGSETTTNAIGYGMKLLIDNPQVWEKLKSDPDKYLRTFCEEVVRLEGPVQGLFRMAANDVEMHGVTIPKGAMVNIRYAAANRDEREFECPEQLDLEREKPGRHVGYGSGIHHCLGAPLARRELFWAFRALIDRVDDMRFAEGKNSFEVAPSFSLRAMKELHVEFDAKPADQRIDPSAMDVDSKATEIDNPANQ